MSNPERDQLTNRTRNVCLTATKRLLLIMPIVLLSTAAVVVAAQEVLRNPSTISTAQERYFMNQNKYVGMWVTADGHIRHELLPKGRYDEARGNRKSAYQGNYRLEGDHIEYVDDTGFTADGDFRDGVLYHAGMVLYREQ